MNESIDTHTDEIFLGVQALVGTGNWEYATDYYEDLPTLVRNALRACLLDSDRKIDQTHEATAKAGQSLDERVRGVGIVMEAFFHEIFDIPLFDTHMSDVLADIFSKSSEGDHDRDEESRHFDDDHHDGIIDPFETTTDSHLYRIA